MRLFFFDLKILEAVLKGRMQHFRFTRDGVFFFQRLARAFQQGFCSIFLFNVPFLFSVIFCCQLAFLTFFFESIIFYDSCSQEYVFFGGIVFAFFLDMGNVVQFFFVFFDFLPFLVVF